MMKKLQDIEKKEIFKVPEGYFDQLPLKIQARLDEVKQAEKLNFIFRYKLQYVLPVLALIIAGIIWLQPSQQQTDVEALLSSIDTSDLMAYINDTDLSNDDLLEDVTIDAAAIQGIENEVYELDINTEQLNDVLDEFNLDSL